MTGTRSLNPNARPLRFFQLHRHLVVEWSSRGAVKRIVRAITSEAADVDFCATILFKSSMEGRAASLSFHAVLIVEYSILYRASELIEIGAPNPLLVAQFLDYPDSVEHIGCRCC